MYEFISKNISDPATKKHRRAICMIGSTSTSFFGVDYDKRHLLVEGSSGVMKSSLKPKSNFWCE